MSDPNLDHLAADLQAMRQAVGSPRKYRRDQIVEGVLLAAGGGVLAIAAAVVPTVWLPVGYATGAALYLIWKLRQGKQLADNQTRDPSAWREWRREIKHVWAIGLTILFMGWMWYGVIPEDARNFHGWASYLAAPTFFFFGLGTLIYALADRSQRDSLAFAVGWIVGGFLFPICTRGQDAWILFGVIFLVGGLTSAITIAWTLRAGEVNRAGS